MSKLERFRSGTGGTVLFYAYLVAILVAGVLLMRGYHDMSVTQDRLDGQQERSCAAIGAALMYWRAERSNNESVLHDPDATAGQIERAKVRIANLTVILSKGRKLDCGG